MRSELHFDYFFLGREGEPHQTMPAIAVKDRSSGMLMAAAVPTKATGVYVANRVMAFMKKVCCEYGDLVVKSDQEPAIQKVVEDVGKLRAAAGGGKYIPENSPVGSSASNGVVERGIQSISGQARVILDAVESRWKVGVPSGHPILCYILEYAAFLLNRFEVSHDGKTSFERCKGKRAKTMGVEFGEEIYWKRKVVGACPREADGDLGRWCIPRSPRKIRRDYRRKHEGGVEGQECAAEADRREVGPRLSGHDHTRAMEGQRGRREERWRDAGSNPLNYRPAESGARDHEGADSEECQDHER